jgi:5-methylcytosine-specific restriction protein B
MSSRSTTTPVRSLSVADLGLSEYLPPENELTFAPQFSLEPLDEVDPILQEVRSALQGGFAGVIFVGPPGTSKSWYASRAAMALVEGDRSRVRFVQFHPSFQYEDFIEGYVPQDQGEFELTPKHFRRLCEDASLQPDKLHVLVVDEISRCDAARVFGEALTYLETSKRGMPFFTSSGTEMSIPPNVVILATMNPWDRGVDDMDIALERRFAHLDMLPRSDTLRQMLSNKSLSVERVDGVVKFFEAVQKLQNPMCHIGHAYFYYVKDDAGLERLWKLQLKYHFSRACRQDLDEFRKIENMWGQLVGLPAISAAEPAAGSPEDKTSPQQREMAPETGTAGP